MSGLNVSRDGVAVEQSQLTNNPFLVISSFVWFAIESNDSKTISASNMGLYALLEAILLIINAIAVLHEERFLAKGKNNWQFV